MCKKCKTFLAIQGSDYCASCNPSSINVTQGQLGNGPQQQTQKVGSFGISVNQQQSQVTGGSQQQSFTAEASGESDKKVSKKLSKIDKRLENIQEDVELIKEYTSQIEKIFEKLETLEDLESFLRKKLSSDFEKIKTTWQDYKSGKITRKELIIQGIKVIGKKFIKIIINSKI